MAAETPPDPQLVADQAAEHLVALQKELVETLTSHFNAAFANQLAAIQTHIRSLEQLDTQLQRAHEQLSAVTSRFSADTDAVIRHFVHAAAHHRKDAPSSPSPPVTRSKSRPASSRDNSRHSKAADGLA